MTRSRAEIDLVLACARGFGSRDLLDVLHKSIAWEDFYNAGAWHGLLPIAYWRLNSECPDAVPSAMLSRLREAFHQTAARNLLLASELLKLLTLLRREQIPAAPLKG